MKQEDKEKLVREESLIIDSLKNALATAIRLHGEDRGEFCSYCGEPRGDYNSCCGEIHFEEEVYLEGVDYVLRISADGAERLEQI